MTFRIHILEMWILFYETHSQCFVSSLWGKKKGACRLNWNMLKSRNNVFLYTPLSLGPISCISSSRKFCLPSLSPVCILTGRIDRVGKLPVPNEFSVWHSIVLMKHSKPVSAVATCVHQELANCNYPIYVEGTYII